MKKLLSLLLTLIIAMSFIPSAYAEDAGFVFEIADLVTGSDDDGYYSTANIQNLTSVTQTGVLVVGSYSADGKFLDYAYTNISLASEGFDSFSVKFETEPTQYQKAFIWDGFGTFEPLSETCELSINATAPNYAIALKLGAEDNQIKLLLADGTTKTFEVDTAKASNYMADFVDDKINNVLDVAGRVVEYRVSGKTGEIVDIQKVSPTTALAGKEYKARTGMLGSGNKILDTTPIMVLKDYSALPNDASNFAVFSKSDLVDGTVYDGYVYRVDTTVSFVVITAIGRSFGESSRFAVAIDEPVEMLTEDGDRVYRINALYEGEVQELLFAFNPGYIMGESFFFETDWDGYVNEIYYPVEGDSAWESMISLDDWSYVLWDTHKPIQFVKGVITEVTSDYVAFATIDQVKSGSLDTTLDLDDTKGDGIVIYEFAGDCVAYTYDAGMMTKFETEKYEVTLPASIKASNFAPFDYNAGVLNDGIYADAYDGDRMIDRATIATAMIVDGEVVEIFAIEQGSSASIPTVPVYSQETLELDASTYYLQCNLVDSHQYSADHTNIRFGTTYYKFTDSIDIYVNGVQYITVDASDSIVPAMLDWIIGNARGTVTLVNTSDTEDAYNTICVDFYQVAEVISVDSSSDGTVLTLSGTYCLLDDTTEIEEIVISNQAISLGYSDVTVTRNGEAATLDTLENGDIIAYATDFYDQYSGTTENPKALDIIATNKVASGVVTIVDKNIYSNYNDNVYTIGGAEYTFVPSIYRASDPSIWLKDSLDLTLDPFGRIYAWETSADAANYAIALKLGAEDEQTKLLLSDGTVKTFEVDTAKAYNYYNDFVDNKINNVKDVADRVVEYEVSGKTGKIVAINKVGAGSILVDREYKSRTSLLGSGNKILDTTPMIRIDEDAQGTILTNNADNYTVYTKADLVDGTTYSGYVYKINTTVAFVVITSAGASFNEASTFAVAIGIPEVVPTEDGDRVFGVKALYDGEEQELLFAYDPGDIQGKIFFFETDSDGFVDSIYYPEEGNPDWESMISLDDWSYVLWDEHKSIQFVEGVVTEVASSYISFATMEQVESGSLDTTLDLDDTRANGIITYGIADDCVAYTYDSSMKTRFESEKYDATLPSSIKASDFTSFDAGNGVLDDGIYQGDLMSKATTATVMIVDGDVVAIFAIER